LAFEITLLLIPTNPLPQEPAENPETRKQRINCDVNPLNDAYSFDWLPPNATNTVGARSRSLGRLLDILRNDCWVKMSPCVFFVKTSFKQWLA
jgi:hypothetical protein